MEGRGEEGGPPGRPARLTRSDSQDLSAFAGLEAAGGGCGGDRGPGEQGGRPPGTSPPYVGRAAGQ